MSNPPANATAALWRFWEEFKAAEPDAVFGGIYASKGGYHNTRNHHRAGTHGGSPDDYSIQRPADRLGPGDKASALDITFKTAQGADYRIIAKYSKRLMAAGKRRDRRFYDSDGETAIVREFFGNVADDGKVDGWSWYRERQASSDPSHLWHIHLSITRAYVDDWSKLAPILGVLLDRASAPAPTPSPTPEDDMPISDADAKKIAVAVWAQQLDPGPFAERVGPYEPGKTYAAGGLMFGADSGWKVREAIEQAFATLPNTVTFAVRAAAAEFGIDLTPEQLEQLAGRTADLTTQELIGAVATKDLPGQPAVDE